MADSDSNSNTKQPFTTLDTYRLLGASGLRVSPLGLGCVTFGTEWGSGCDKEQSRKVKKKRRSESPLSFPSPLPFSFLTFLLLLLFLLLLIPSSTSSSSFLLYPFLHSSQRFSTFIVRKVVTSSILPTFTLMVVGK
jgi:hypothetical protein